MQKLNMSHVFELKLKMLTFVHVTCTGLYKIPDTILNSYNFVNFRRKIKLFTNVMLEAVKVFIGTKI